MTMARDGLSMPVALGQRKSEAQDPGIAVMDEQTFHLLYSQTAGTLRAYVARVLGNVTQADDIVQESYLRIVRTTPTTANPQQLRVFLFRIANNLIVDHWRSRKHEGKMPSEGVMVEASARPDNIPLRLDMARMFEQLKPRERQLVWLAYVEGSDHREIATALGLRERSVRVMLHRAKRKLARLLRQQGTGQK
jgi:RNA polymerase sigma-70 factor (ECF subfamily)